MQQTREFGDQSRRQLRVGWAVVLLTLFLSGVCAGTASACLNDKEIVRGEAEFRSRYDVPPPSAIVDKTTFKPLGWIALGVGAGLTVGSLIVMRERRKRGVA